ncbi:hypothetical protein BKA80DRAFT_317294 [Phyllosticta citrichinensis]
MDGGLMIYGAKKPNGTSSRQVVWSRNNNVDVVLCFSIRVFVRQPVNMTSSLDTRPVPAWAPSSSKSFIMAHVCFTLRCLLVASPPAGYPSKGSECGVWVADNALIADFWIAESNAHNETALQSSESELEHTKVLTLEIFPYFWTLNVSIPYKTGGSDGQKSISDR